MGRRIILRDWLKNSRKKENLLQKELALLVDVDVTSIGKYEKGERRPSVDTAKKIAVVLGFDWTKFYEDEAKV